MLVTMCIKTKSYFNPRNGIFACIPPMIHLCVELIHKTWKTFSRTNFYGKFQITYSLKVIVPQIKILILDSRTSCNFYCQVIFMSQIYVKSMQYILYNISSIRWWCHFKMNMYDSILVTEWDILGIS